MQSATPASIARRREIYKRYRMNATAERDAKHKEYYAKWLAKNKNKRSYKIRRQIAANKYYNKVSAWPLESTVYYQFAGQWLAGKIVAKNNSAAEVQFKTFSQWIAFKKLSKVKPFVVLEQEVA